MAKASVESRGCKKKFVFGKEPLLSPNTPLGEGSHPTYSVLQRCSNVVPSSAGDDWDIFTVGESDRG